MIPWGERLGYRYKKPRWAIIAKVADTALSPLGRFIRASARKPHPHERILVVRLDHIGDLLCSFPAINTLRRNFADAHISLLVGPWCEELAQLNGNVDEIIVYRAPWFDRQRKRKHPLSTVSMLVLGARMLKQRHFDIALDLRGDLRNILLMAFSRIPIRVGYDDVGGEFLLTHPVRRNRWQHEIFRALSVVRAIGCNNGAPTQIELRIPDGALNGVTKLLSEFGIANAPLVFLVHPYGGEPARWWIDDGFRDVCRYLCYELGACIVFTGSYEERQMVERIREACGDGGYNLAGSLNLHELIALVYFSDCVITVNTCTMHFASALNVPQIVVFSSQVHKVEWAPIFGEHVLLHAPTECTGCELPACPLPNHPCMGAIKPEHVIDAVAKLMPLIMERAKLRAAKLKSGVV